MIITINSCEIFGLDVRPVEVEVLLAGGKPVFDIVGLPDAAINEAKIRVRSALGQSVSGYPYTKRVIVNLAPADLPKVGPSYDLAMAVGIVLCQERVDYDLRDALFVGELSLEGKVRPVKGVMAIVDYAKQQGFKKVFLPERNINEARIISDIDLYPVRSINEIVAHLRKQAPISPDRIPCQANVPPISNWQIDLAHIKGQHQARRALEIAAAGQHNLIISGPPGSGKTLLAKALPSILPPLSYEEMLEVTKIYSISGMLPQNNNLINQRPFRSPHHTASSISLIGGGRIPKPGEVTLAHRGVLFLDEFPEFSRQSLETLRQPIEEGTVSISRVEASLSYPARFMLIAAQNPCPCGYLGDGEQECICSPLVISRYQMKISGPILDRIDLQVSVKRIPIGELKEVGREENSARIRERVEVARRLQLQRFQGQIKFNAHMNAREVAEACRLDSSAEFLLTQAAQTMKLSARSYFRILKVARTIADLGGSVAIGADHLAEALHFRFS